MKSISHKVKKVQIKPAMHCSNMSKTSLKFQSSSTENKVKKDTSSHNWKIISEANTTIQGDKGGIHLFGV